jgi:hypothetical protein
MEEMLSETLKKLNSVSETENKQNENLSEFFVKFDDLFIVLDLKSID